MLRVAINTGSLRLNQTLLALLKDLPRFEIVMTSLDEFRASDRDLASAADVVVTDAPARAAEDAATVLLSDEEDLLPTLRPLRGGLALLSTSASPEQIVAAIEAAAAGLAVVHPDHTASLSARTGDDPLTPREHEVLQLLAAGLGNKEIAGRLTISDHTAKFHVSQILAKLNAASRAEAVSIAMRRGLVPL